MYINNGNGSFSISRKSLPKDLINDNSVSIGDINGDGFPDIFNGGFCVPGKYPEASGSQVLLNDGKGNFTRQDQSWLKDFNKQGLVTASVIADINKDGKSDLIVAGHWMGIELYLNTSGHLARDTSFTGSDGLNGLYNTLTASDLDGDGDTDLVAGNQGLNNQFRTTDAEPMEMYYNDFDGNGTSEAVISYYIDHKAWPIYSRDDLMQQIPSYNKKYLQYADFANADMQNMFGDKLASAHRFSASQMNSMILENTGKKFKTHLLPKEAQWYPIYSINVIDINGDGRKDIITGGNQTYSRIRFGAYGAGRGDVFINNGKFIFERLPATQGGLAISGDIRNAVVISNQIVFGINDRNLLCYRFQQ
jgi:hypothetical protein